MHLLCNCVALFGCGRVIEVWLGRAWWITIFVASALGSSLLGFWFGDPNIVRVGASGAILGLACVALMVILRLPMSREKTEWGYWLGSCLIYPVLGIFTQEAGIDHLGHMGGAITGIAFAFLIKKMWTTGKAPDLPPYLNITAGLATLSLAVCLGMAATSGEDPTLGNPTDSQILMFNGGELLMFNGGELYYTTTVSLSEAERLGRFLVSEEFFDGNRKTVQLNKTGSTYEFRMVIKKGLEQDQDIIVLVRRLATEISLGVFGGETVDIHLCDETLNTIRVVVVF
jgi:hypothetical protein